MNDRGGPFIIIQQYRTYLKMFSSDPFDRSHQYIVEIFLDDQLPGLLKS